MTGWRADRCVLTGVSQNTAAAESKVVRNRDNK